MDDTAQQVALVAVSTALIGIGIALPLLTLWRLRTPRQRRDEWLSANAQPVMTTVLHAATALFSIIIDGACALGAIAGYSFLRAPTISSSGLLVSTIITATIARNPPADPRSPS